MINHTLLDFSKELSSKASVPGGGGASGLVGALAASLGCMVANLTIGKAKYKETEPEMIACLEKLEQLQKELLDCINGDAIAFEPLSKAYSLPKDDPDRVNKLESCLLVAANSPLKMMKLICQVIELLDKVSLIGSKLAVSDAATGAMFAYSALNGAAINVACNSELMKNKEVAESLNKEVISMQEKYNPIALNTYNRIFGGMING